MSKKEWWRGAVIYQIYPRSFKDSNNDGIGDLKGITEKLDYIASLGVAGVWISPFFKSPMADFGYDVSDYRDIDPLFGTLKDFDEMLEGMHKRGLKLIVDLVLNHSSDRHPWFAESRKDKKNSKADWYVWHDAKPDGTPPNNWLSVFGGSAWHFDTKRGQYYLCTFLPQQPDLNIGNPAVQDALLDTMKFWLDKGVDGFRLDAISHFMYDKELRDNPPKTQQGYTSNLCLSAYNMQRHVYDMFHPENPAFLKRMRKLTDSYKDRMMVAEIGGDEDPIKHYVEYTGAPEMLHTAYNFSFLSNHHDAALFRDVITEVREASDYSWPAWAFSNHDFPRSATRWAKDGKVSKDQVKMLNALLLSLRGTPFIYQGEELGLSEVTLTYEQLQDPFGKYLWPESQGRDGCRTPMPWDHSKPNADFSAHEPWLPVPQDHKDNAVDVQEKDKNSPLNFFRNFIKWRTQHPALITGDIRFLNPAEPVLAFAREKIITVFNLGSKTETYILPEGTKALDNHGLPYELAKTQLTLPPFGGFFGELK